MKKLIIIILILLTQLSVASPTTSNDINKQKDKELIKRIVEEELRMNPDKIKTILDENKIEFEQNDNVITFEIQGYNMTIIYDINADRMRIVCPIANLSDITKDHISQAMEANFHTALDARYAISNEVVWSVFIHPLSDLSEKLFQSALEQTLYAAATFGKQYSSGALNFPKQEQTPEDEKSDKPKAEETKETEI